MIRRAGPLATGLLLSAASLAAMAVVLLAGEVAVRLLRPDACAQTRAEAENIEASRRYLAPCFTVEHDGGDDYLVSPPGSSDGAPPVRLPRRKRDGVPRIAVIGESSADLLAKHLAKLGDAPGCEGRFEVLNCAQPGSGLEHVERRFNEVLAYEPDAVVLLFGHNIFFRFPLDETQLRLQGWRSHSCLLSQLTPDAAPPEAPSLDARLGAFEKFLRRAAAGARARGVPLAVATMPGNLWLPPSSNAAADDDPRFLAARFLEARGQRDAAIARLEALARDDDVPYWHYQLGEQLARAGGDDARAARELHRALDGDGLRLRAPSRVNERLRSVAADEKLLLRDTERALESRAPGGLPGWDSFIDNCHLQPAALELEAAAVLSLLRQVMPLLPACAARSTGGDEKGLADVLAGVFKLTASGPPEVAQVWYRGLALAVESWIGRDRDRADRDVHAFLDGPAFAAARGDERSTRVLVAIADGYDRAGWHDRAMALNQRARDDGGAGPWVQKGVFHLRQNQPDDARRAFERALALDGSRADARGFLKLMSESDAGEQTDGNDSRSR